jgi:DNA ligase N terminus/ATP dependent DNA ligase C terminal region
LRRFAALYEVLDRTSSTHEKVAALAGYFAAAPPEDAAWAVFFLTGRRLERRLPVRTLAAWAIEAAGVPPWLFEESYAAAGDLAETIALLLDGLGGEPGDATDVPLSEWVEGRILPLRTLPPEEQRAQVCGWWRELGRRETFVLNKMLTGALRAGVSQTLVDRALAHVAGVDPPAAAPRPPEDPRTFDAVLLYAQPGHGWRASLLTDYTFAVWSVEELVPVAKAHAGLSDPEIVELDAWIRRHTRQKFGPVRAVEPVQVFELAFEGIALSPRHRAGIAVRSPRIARWRRDKTAEQAETLEAVRAMLTV